MRALWRHCLAPLVVSAAVLFAGAPAQQAPVAAHLTVTLTDQACPGATNWDNILRVCR
jgi:hypothetical protein